MTRAACNESRGRFTLERRRARAAEVVHGSEG